MAVCTLSRNSNRAHHSQLEVMTVEVCCLPSVDVRFTSPPPATRGEYAAFNVLELRCDNALTQLVVETQGHYRGTCSHKAECGYPGRGSGA
uniref:ZP domain-containing protein n=1 Tax=Echinococcus granulosus TaxID=6210 RepID=A0A068WAK6_ECHGR|nr:hypothetical protein EgrG_002016200 [Echinococcus granulosus]